MKPTMKLRFVERVVAEWPVGSLTEKVLQQWWASEPHDYDGMSQKYMGEWRDVPVETEETK